jgi:hypothetical protein
MGNADAVLGAYLQVKLFFIPIILFVSHPYALN